jgi:hypothetical protein
MRQYNDNRDHFFKRNPDPKTLVRLRDSGGMTQTSDPTPNEDVTDAPDESTQIYQVPSQTATEDSTDTHGNENSQTVTLAKQDTGNPHPQKRGHKKGIQPSQSQTSEWYRVKTITAKRRLKGKNEFLVHWMDNTKQWVEQSQITPAALDEYYVKISKRKQRRGRPRRSI